MRKEPLYFGTHIKGSHRLVLGNLDSIEPFGSVGWQNHKVYMTEEQYAEFRNSGRLNYICFSRISLPGKVYFRNHSCLGGFIDSLSEKEQALVKENIAEIMAALNM